MKTKIWLLLILIILQFFLINHYMPISEVITPQPIVNDDYPLHLYDVLLHRESILSGNSEFIVFGYGQKVLYVAGLYKSMGVAILSLMFPINVVVFFKIYFFAMSLFLPLLIYFSGINFGLEKKIAFISGLFSIVLWNFSNPIHSEVYYGLIPYLFLIPVWILGISFFNLFRQEKKEKYLIIGTIILAYTFFMHPFFWVLSVPAIFLMFLFSGPKHRLVLFGIVGILIVVVVHIVMFRASINLPSKEPMFHQGKLDALISELIFSPIYIISLILGIWGVIISKNKNFKLIGGGGMIFLFCLGYLGNYFPINFLQLSRATFALSFLCTIPSGLALITIFQKKKVLVILGIFALIYIFISPYSITEQWEKTISTEIPPHLESLIDWIRENGEETILFETSGAKTNHFYLGHINILFPQILNMEFAGNPYPYIGSSNNFYFSNFYEGILHDSPISNYTCSSLNRVFNVFKIRTIVAFTPESQSKFFECGFLESKTINVESGGEIRIYKINSSHPEFYDGKSSFTFSKRMINSSSEFVILRQRYYPSLKTLEGFKLYPVKVNIFNNYSIDFVKVENNMKPFTLTS